ncbi:MAG: hypothetical protein QOE05_3401 [Actinomycetota bacterium]|nr:hypothetical protein [Actinomycetota bacterium]
MRHAPYVARVDTNEGVPVIELVRWSGPWAADDPDANFKAEVADYGRLDPLRTVTGLANNLDIPVGAVVRYVLARWATAGSGGLLELGPTMVNRLWEPIARADEAGTDEARLAAYAELRSLLSWLKYPLDDETVYEP